MRSKLIALVSVCAGILGCMMIAAVLGEDPISVFKVLVLGSFSSLPSLGETLFYATPLIFTGLAVAVAFHAGLFNIGAEGQLYVGALALVITGIKFPNAPLAPLIGTIAAFVAAGIWGSIAGYLKAYRGSHEVIATIMLNFISYAMCGYFILNVFRNPLSPNPESAEVSENYFIGGLGKLSEASGVNRSFFFALLVAAVVWVVLNKTRWGFEVRLSGSAPETARRSGVPVKARIVQTMFVSGGLAGLVGVNEIMGSAHKFRSEFSAGYGFIGIAVALLSRSNPIAVVFSALLFGALEKGALDLELDTSHITRDLAHVMQALLILSLTSDYLWLKLFRKKQWA